MKIFVAKFNRAENAVDILIEKLKENDMYTDKFYDADYYILSGDRSEMFDFAVLCLRDNNKVIHLWAGECEGDWTTNDEAYRSFITLSSMMQLCTNDRAVARVVELCRATEKKPNVHVVGNLMIDDLKTDESFIPDKPYTLVLYNPPVDKKTTKIELIGINHILKSDGDSYIWIQPNGDANSDLIKEFVTEEPRSRPEFLGLMKNCSKFITNSSCQYYEAPFLMDKENIVSIGNRNSNRDSKFADMTISGATDNIIRILKELE